MTGVRVLVASPVSVLSFLVTSCGHLIKPNCKMTFPSGCKQNLWVGLLGKLFTGDGFIWEASEGALVPSSFFLLSA